MKNPISVGQSLEYFDGAIWIPCTVLRPGTRQRQWLIQFSGKEGVVERTVPEKRLRAADPA